MIDRSITQRIAADLHDTVIRRLFATTLGLLGTVAIIDNAAAAERIPIDDLDETITSGPRFSP